MKKYAGDDRKDYIQYDQRVDNELLGKLQKQYQTKQINRKNSNQSNLSLKTLKKYNDEDTERDCDTDSFGHESAEYKE